MTIDGRPGGPFRADAEVVACERQGAYVAVSVSAPEIGATTRPGQFVNVAVEAPACILRRPFSVYGAERDGTVRFVLDPHGPGTRWLAERTPGDVLDVVGPLGTPFTVSDAGACLLVGGGYGAAPLFFLADELRGEGSRVDLIIGAATAERLFDPKQAERTSTSLHVTTDDGSAGHEGVVTDVFDDVVETADITRVYACGPMPMLREVSRAAARHELPCEVAVEEHMACGVGVCWTCVVPVRDPGDTDAAVHMRRSCLDGPVFDAARIAWDDSRWRASANDTFTPNPTVSARVGTTYE